MIPTGKIARLPGSVREELNRRLYDGEPSPSLLDWLNSLPETQRILAAQFNARPINKPNLSAWRSGGYLAWLTRRQALSDACQLPSQARELTEAAGGKLTSHLTTLLAARYAAALVDWDGEVTDNFRRKLRVLRGLCHNVVRLRRNDQNSAWLDLEHDRLEWQRQKTPEIRKS